MTAMQQQGAAAKAATYVLSTTSTAKTRRYARYIYYGFYDDDGYEFCYVRCYDVNECFKW